VREYEHRSANVTTVAAAAAAVAAVVVYAVRVYFVNSHIGTCMLYRLSEFIREPVYIDVNTNNAQKTCVNLKIDLRTLLRA